MICPNCKKEANDNLSMCPHCLTILNDKVVRSAIRSKTSRSVLNNTNISNDISNVNASRNAKGVITITKRRPNKKVEFSTFTNPVNPTFGEEEKYIEKDENNQDIYFSFGENKEKSFNLFKFMLYLGVIGGWIFALVFIIKYNREDYYFQENESGYIKDTGVNTRVDEEMLKYDAVSKSGQTGGSSSEGVTSIVYDNQYLRQFTISNLNDIERLIVTDSVKQKNNCPNNIVRIENEIIQNYGIIAVNFCEIDEEFARELRDVVKFVYNNYPNARNYLTNLTLANVGENSTFMAAFMPIFTFATSSTSTTYPQGVKTQIVLNAKYFLNNSKMKNTVNYASKSGYFPPNTSRSSTVAHEFGHYLSYVAMLNYYESKQLNYVPSSQAALLYKVYNDFNEGNFSYKLLTEAYEEYKKIYKDSSFEDFRKSISQYAIAKDKSGGYIYDETIAEAFHDVYLNGDLAEPASKYIIEVLNRKL